MAVILYTEILELLLCFQSFYRLLFTAVELWGLVFSFYSGFFHPVSASVRSVQKPLSYSSSLWLEFSPRCHGRPPLVPNITDMTVVCGLRCADWQTFTGLQYCSCGRSSTKLSVAAIKHFDNLVLKFLGVFFYPRPSHAPALRHKVSVTPDPTYPGSSSCKSLLASHCAVPQSNVSSNDCAINTSEWLLPLCSINMRTFV